ncbi:MAG: dihydroorotate dehydrogenase [Lachnospiraceae bacterium]|nr:dihydroorotate dehydrogenase [Lachnospiraceae bacterium]
MGDMIKREDVDLSVEIAGIRLKNPVMTASGTYGSGMEYSEWIDISALGAITAKGISDVPWSGNPAPRIAETPSGMLNAIGLQNPGVEEFIRRDLPFLKNAGCGVIVNVAGHEPDEYYRVIERLNGVPGIDMLEINISCPNVKAGGLVLGTDPKMVEEITKGCKKRASQPVIMKLTPNVTDIKILARACEEGGADAVSLINTLTGMRIDIERQTFVLANRVGGLSGPAVLPVAVRMVYECANTVSIPVIGMGGISCASDAIEFMLAGASAVSIGMANFINPHVTLDVIEGMRDYCARHGVRRVSEVTGAVR